MDFGLLLASIACVCAVILGFLIFIVSLFTRLKWLKLIGGYGLIGLLILSSFVWGLTYKVHYLDEGLWDAVYDGDTHGVKYFLDKGADPQATFEGETIVEVARKVGNAEVIEIIEKRLSRH